MYACTGICRTHSVPNVQQRTCRTRIFRVVVSLYIHSCAVLFSACLQGEVVVMLCLPLVREGGRGAERENFNRRSRSTTASNQRFAHPLLGGRRKRERKGKTDFLISNKMYTHRQDTQDGLSTPVHSPCLPSSFLFLRRGTHSFSKKKETLLSPCLQLGKQIAPLPPMQNLASDVHRTNKPARPPHSFLFAHGYTSTHSQISTFAWTAPSVLRELRTRMWATSTRVKDSPSCTSVSPFLFVCLRMYDDSCC